jgi:beta-glucosidase
LRELYLAPFEIIVREAGAWAVMAAYNGVNGTTMTEHPMLRDLLKDEWGFDGVVMSDWYAARSNEPAANAALDLVMPGPTGPWGEALIAAIRDGRVEEAMVDDKVLRLLRLAARVGALDGVEPAAPWSDSEVAAELRATAAAGFVLARNDGPLLPLGPSALRRVAVLGPNAAAARTLGGGSATVFPPYTVSPLDGLRAALGPGVQVDHAIGVRSTDRLPPAPLDLLRHPGGSGQGVEVRFVDADGSVLGREHRNGTQLTWLGSLGNGLPVADVAAVEIHTLLRAPETGIYLLGGSGLGRFRLTIDDAVAFDTTLGLPEGADPVEGMMRPPQHSAGVDLDTGEEISLVLRYEPQPAGGFGEADLATVMFQLNAARQIEEEDEEFERAVALAADADVAVVVVGTTEEVESEGFDRETLALPGRQDELVRAVAAENPRTVVVVNAGAPVLMPWVEEVPAVLLAWFPGQEFGNALADVLLGDAEPGGRLPTTWPVTADGLPPTVPVDGVLTYEEGLFVGYRWYDREDRTPRYPFGHGLGYTTWEYVDVEALEKVGDGENVPVRARLRNTGTRPGREVVQVYASRPDSNIERPPRWLAGFAVVDAGPNVEVTAEVLVPARAFAHWDTAAHAWAVEPGAFTLSIGRSSRDLRWTVPVLVGTTDSR